MPAQWALSACLPCLLLSEILPYKLLSLLSLNCGESVWGLALDWSLGSFRLSAIQHIKWKRSWRILCSLTPAKRYAEQNHLSSLCLPSLGKKYKRKEYILTHPLLSTHPSGGDRRAFKWFCLEEKSLEAVWCSIRALQPSQKHLTKSHRALLPERWVMKLPLAIRSYYHR